MNWEHQRGRRMAASPCLRGVLMSVALLFFVASGCRPAAHDEDGISIEQTIAPQPARVGTETISFRLTDASHQPVSGAHVQVEGDMSHPGMAPVFADATEVSPGSYTAQLPFTMGGDWVVLFHITLSNGRKVERQIGVKGVESN